MSVKLDDTHSIGMPSSAYILPYYNALAKGLSPVDLGLANDGEDAYLQCLDPQKYTVSGTVTFKISRKANSNS